MNGITTVEVPTNDSTNNRGLISDKQASTDDTLIGFNSGGRIENKKSNH
jgi:hypothetical protein